MKNKKNWMNSLKDSGVLKPESRIHESVMESAIEDIQRDTFHSLIKFLQRHDSVYDIMASLKYIKFEDVT